MNIPKELCNRIIACENHPDWATFTGVKTKWASHDFYFVTIKEGRFRITNPMPEFVPELLEAIAPITDKYKFDQIRVTRYNTGDYIESHQDLGELDRTLTIVIQLSDPKDYDGGELIVEGKTMDKEQGSVLTHDPMKDWHEVMPVTRGVRYTLVIWLKDLDKLTD